MNNGESSYRRFLDGDESAFDDIMELYRDTLTRFIDGYVKNFAAAEDIAIDVFTYVLVHKHRYNFKTSLKTYLFMLGRSRAINFIRRRKSLATVDITEAENELYFSSPEEDVLLDERKRVVREGLSRLPADMREVITLVYFEGLSYEECGRVMKKSKKQIDNLLYRSKEKLRSVIGKEGELLL
ncbi:MAG: sigma-70 family RNA polymerase sigma factor [Ruminococcaceae bacterium]|nr:sigma-70 family RNA polymerase sigma factor [Oscillospiraceae bacterium]